MSKLEIAKKVIAENIDDARCGIYDTRNMVGDTMETLYDSNDLTIDICYFWMYFEVFGLTDNEFAELEKYYKTLLR